MEEEQSIKGLDEKYKKFKTTFYDLNTKIVEIELKMKQYSKINPELLLVLNKNPQ